MKITQKQLRSIIQQEAKAALIEASGLKKTASGWTVNPSPAHGGEMWKSFGPLAVRIDFHATTAEKFLADVLLNIKSGSRVTSIHLGEVGGQGTMEETLDEVGEEIANFLKSIGSNLRVDVSAADATNLIISQKKSMEKASKAYSRRGPSRYTDTELADGYGGIGDFYGGRGR